MGVVCGHAVNMKLILQTSHARLVFTPALPSPVMTFPLHKEKFDLLPRKLLLHRRGRGELKASSRLDILLQY